MLLKFANNGIKFETFCDLLREREKVHNMKTRDPEQYEVEFANTERLKNSCVIQMQKILNQDILSK